MPELLFPYMSFARTQAFRSSLSLTQSGMPSADAKLLGDTLPIDLAFAGKEALPALQARIGAHLGVAPERVLVTMGASSAMHVLALALFQPGVRVISETPSYEPLRALPRRLGADLKLLERRPERRFALDVARADDLARGSSGACHVFVTNPNNPTGARSTSAELAGLARIAERTGGALISCEVYMEFELDDARRVHAYRVAPNGITIGSLTKAYGLGPLRVGWIVLGEGLTGLRATIEDMMFLTYVDPPTATLRGALRAFDVLDALRTPIARMERESKPVLRRWLESNPRIDGFAPDLGLTAFPRVVGVDDTAALARHLVAEHDVDVVPGEFFDRAGHLRIGCGLEAVQLEQALGRVANGIASFQAR